MGLLDTGIICCGITEFLSSEEVASLLDTILYYVYSRVSANIVALFDRYTTILCGIQYYTIWYTILAAMLYSTRSSTRSMIQHTEHHCLFIY